MGQPRPSVKGEFAARALTSPVAAVQTLADARVAEHVRSVVLQNTSPHASLHVIATAALEHDRVDAGAMKEMGQEKARGAGAQDPDLCADVTDR